MHRVSRVLGRAWGAHGEGGGGPCRTLVQVRWRITKIVRLACVFDFGAPSRIRTCAHGSGVQIRIQPLPAGTPPGLCARGAYGAREIVVLSFAICRHYVHDPGRPYLALTIVAA